MMLTLSQDGIDLIHAFEGCVLKIYKDSAGIDTIGWGHRVWPEEIPQFQNGITQEQADALFLKDAAKKENSVRDLIFCPLWIKLSQDCVSSASLTLALFNISCL